MRQFPLFNFVTCMVHMVLSLESHLKEVFSKINIQSFCVNQRKHER